MQRERITPESEAHWLELRKKDLTSTGVAALFDCSPYTTRYQLWHEYVNDVPSSFKDNERVAWGRHLEAAIAMTVAEEEKLIVMPFKDYMRIPELRIGSSFDYTICKQDDDGVIYNSSILEIKNVDSLQFKNGWSQEDDNIEAPLHIEIQIQHQMLVSGLDVCEIRALVGGNKLVKIQRTANKEFQDMIIEKCAEFWKSVDDRQEPPANFEKDAAFVAKLYSFVQPGTIMLGDERLEELAVKYKEHSRLEAIQTTAKKACKAEMLTLIGEAEKVRGDGFSISAGMIGPAIISYTREPYRDFRVFIKKEK